MNGNVYELSIRLMEMYMNCQLDEWKCI